MYNQLISLDISNNTALNWLYCEYSQIATLDVSNQLDLHELQCNGNQLTSLDVSNNIVLEELNISNMSSLSEVCVWTLPFPPEGMTVDTTGSPNVYFTTECIR
jgi:hypothetical protein